MGKWAKRMIPELAEAISKRYDGTTETINKLVKEFSVPRYIITLYACRNGYAKKKTDKNWSKEEVEFLINNWSRGREYVSKKLKRTVRAVNMKAKRIGLGGCVKGSHYLTAKNVANIMNIDIHAVLNWLSEGFLKYKLAPVKRTAYLIGLSDLEKFLKNNQSLWDSRKMRGSLWLKEPEWFKEKRKRDAERPPKEGKKWTNSEDHKAIALFKTGHYTCKEIGEVLGRSPDAVRRRLSRIDVWNTMHRKPVM